MIMTARAVALVLAVLTAGGAMAADSDFTFTGSQFAIDKDVMECTSACVLRFKSPYRFSIGQAFPLRSNDVKPSDLRFFIGSSQFEIDNMSEMTSLPDGFVRVKAETIRMTRLPPTL
jgi:hypothetical protein